jgi:hypothetical protein
MSGFTDEKVALPKPIEVSGGGSNVDYYQVNFVRTSSNTNISIECPLGAAQTATIYYSPNEYLPSNAFNVVGLSDSVEMISNRDAKVTADVSILHDIYIQFKLQKGDKSNYSNQREMRMTLVNDSEVVYDSNIFANQQRQSNIISDAVMKGVIAHSANDIVKIKFYISQNNGYDDHGDTMLTIFRINWLMTLTDTPA